MPADNPAAPSPATTPATTYPPDCLGCGCRFIDHGEPSSACPEFGGGFSTVHTYRDSAPPASDAPAPPRETAELCPKCGEPIRNLGYPDSYRPGCATAQCRLIAAIEKVLATGAKTVSNGLAPHYDALTELRAAFAASPAQEATPPSQACPRWGTCFSNDCTCHHGAAPTPEASAPEPTLRSLFGKYPDARRATDEEFIDNLLADFAYANKQLADLRAAVAALTAERARLTLLLDGATLANDQLRHERDAAEASLRDAERLRRIGAEFANVAYNICQRGKLDPGVRLTLSQLQCQWDAAARRAAPRGDAAPAVP